MNESKSRYLLIMLFCLSCFPLIHSQVIYFDDFSNPQEWTEVGSRVHVFGGRLQFVDGAPCGQQRRVFKALEHPISFEEDWTMTLEFIPVRVGTYRGEPFTGHMIFALTENTSDPVHDCYDIECTDHPPGTQDVLCVNYHANNPPDGNVRFKIFVKKGTEVTLSETIPYNALNNPIYVELTKKSDVLKLAIFSDPTRNQPLGQGPVTLKIPALKTLNHIQHSCQSGGYYLRELTGTVDDVRIELNDENDPETNEGNNTIIKIFPNPGNEILNIDIECTVTPFPVFDLRMYSIHGPLLFETSLAEKHNTLELSPDLPSGPYILQINQSATGVDHRQLCLVTR